MGPPGYGAYPPAPPFQPTAPSGAALADWGQRFASLLLDILLVGFVAVVMEIILAVIESTALHGFHNVTHCNQFGCGQTSTAEPWAYAVDVALWYLAWAVYFVPMNGIGSGQTVGNRALGIAVQDARTGGAIGLGRGFIRFIVRTLLWTFFWIPGLLNDLWPLWDEQRQTLADKAANSVMVRTR